MNYFWLHRDQIYEQGLSLGFKTFSAGHILWLICIAVFCYITGLFYRSRNGQEKDRMRKICGIVIVLLEYTKMIVMGLFQINTLEFVPLHLCSIAGFATLVYACWPGKRSIGQVFAYAFFPAALLAVVCPSTTMYPWWNFYCIHTFVFHALILAYFVWLFMDGEIAPDYRGLWSGILFMAVLAVPIYYLDGVFNVNYMFIGMRSDVGVLASLWDAIVPRFGRLGFTAVLAMIMVAVAHILYGVYFILQRYPLPELPVFKNRGKM